MKKIFFALLFLTTGFLACDTKVYDDFPPCTDCVDFAKLNKEDGQAYLNAWYKKLNDLAKNETCTDPSEFKIVPIGSKPVEVQLDILHLKKYQITNPILRKLSGIQKLRKHSIKNGELFQIAQLLIHPKA